MMRYERVAPSEECVPKSNGKKPSFKTTSKPIPIYNNGSSPSSSSSRFRSQDQSPHFNGGHGGGGDLFQWGQKKRSRASRTSTTDDSSSSSSAPFKQQQQTSTKIQKRRLNLTQTSSSSSPVVEKLSMPPPPPPLPQPPSMAAAASNGRRRSSISNKDSSRNSEDRSHPGNGISRVNSRSTVVGIRSLPSLSPEKVDKKKPSTFGWSTKKEKSNKSSEAKNQNSSISTTAVAEGEKGIAKVLEWPRIYLTLSRKEKEDDFLAMKGTKLPHRPKKRPKTIDRTLQYCFPGMWLSDLTRSRYEVREKKSAKKQKRRGLKGMESMDSDSES